MTQHTPVGSKWTLVGPMWGGDKIPAEVVRVVDRWSVVIAIAEGEHTTEVPAATLMANALRVKEPTP